MSRGNYASKWSSEDCAEIKRLLIEGLSCSQIGARFGVSRNAIIGINHRRGLFMHNPSAPKAAPKAAHAVKIAAPKRIKAKIARQPANPARARGSPPRMVQASTRWRHWPRERHPDQHGP